MKKSIALFLTALLVFSVSAMSFAAVGVNDYKVVIEKPQAELKLFNDKDLFFVTGYIAANQNDVIKWVELNINGMTKVYSTPAELSGILSPWKSDRVGFKIVVEPSAWNMQNSGVGYPYDITVKAHIDPEGTLISDQQVADTERVVLHYGFATSYNLDLTHPAANLVVSSWSQDPLIKGWIQADEGDVLESLVILIEELGTSNQWTLPLVQNASSYVTMTNDKHDFEKKWDITKAGDFRITVTARLNVDESTSDVWLTDVRTVKITYNPNAPTEPKENGEAYPAAPAVAGKILKAHGIPNNVGGKNLIALVAKEMGPGAVFKGIAKTDAARYQAAITDFLEDQLNVSDLSKFVVTKTTGSGKPEAVTGKGKVK